MIYSNLKEIYQIYKDSKTITYVYKGLHLVWEGIKACFSSGIWRGEKKWLNDAKWKNNR